MADQHPQPDRAVRLDHILHEYQLAIDSGAPPPRDHFLAKYPEFEAELWQFFADLDRVRFMADDLVAGTQGSAADTPANGTTGDGSAGPGQADAAVRTFGDYEVRRELAHGGMGVVFEARQISLNRSVALKMILTGRFASPPMWSGSTARPRRRPAFDIPTSSPFMKSERSRITTTSAWPCFRAAAWPTG